ncbi:MAG: aldose epimerase family protein [Opitutaceae bacterium]|nr:aldose epimerase family protein [Opitutaceae bacterium]
MTAAAPLRPSVHITHHGVASDGKEVRLFTITNGRGHVVSLSEYGAAVVDLCVADRNQIVGDVSLGYDSLHGFLGKGNPYFGAIVGRVGNRIAKGRFSIEGREYVLACNNGVNHLHGGVKGFDKQVWSGTADGAQTVSFSLFSRDGDEGYPGNLQATVTYHWSDTDELRIDYVATTDKATPVNLTNHAYFNLSGMPGTSILGHIIQIHAERYVPVSETLIPTGELAPVEGTPMDLRQPTRVGDNLAAVGGDPVGFDHTFVISGSNGQLRLAAEVREPGSGRRMRVLTTEPGVQFYTGNFLDGSQRGKGGAAYGQHSGFCLETQHYPDSPNQPTFPSVILKPGQTYRTTTVYAFDAI